MKKIFKPIASIAFIVAIVSMICFSSCSKEPDEEDLYTFTGMTIMDFLTSEENPYKDSLTVFVQVLEKSRYDRLMSSYGQYTCYAPTDNGFITYIDSLYNDEEAFIEHNGLSANSVEALLENDSLCKELTRMHLSSGLYTTMELGADVQSTTFNTMLGREFTSRALSDGENMGTVELSYKALMLYPDNELTNGYVHVIDNIIPHSSRTTADEIKRDATISLFSQILELTGLADSITATYKTNSKGEPITYTLGSHNNRDGATNYYPTQCKLKYTVFAETDKVFADAGINSLSDLIEKCKEWYKDAADWYQYPAEKGISISTGDDYTNPFNVVNMFVAYHIIKAGMPVDRIVYQRNTSNANWNYAFGGEPHDYFETMLPHTLMKIWQPMYHNTGSAMNLWINRYRAHNTLTNQVGLQGSDDMHELVSTGVQIVRSNNASISASNGYVHKLDGILLYDRLVPQGVLNERLRLDTSTFLYELINNGIRGATETEIYGLPDNGYAADQSRVAFALNYFDNIKCYNANTVLRFCVQGAWRAHESDQMQGWSQYDFAVRIPPVPTGTYEIRMFYPPMERGGLMQFYLGTSSAQGSMQALGIPLDARLPKFDTDEATAMGWVDPSAEDDYGVETDVMLRNNGYMRAPCSFSRGTYNTVISPVTDISQITGSTNCRTETGYGTSMIRTIVGRMQLKQSENYWLRIKNLITDDPNLGWSFDFIELVPISVVDNQEYMEDWY